MAMLRKNRRDFQCFLSTPGKISLPTQFPRITRSLNESQSPLQRELNKNGNSRNLSHRSLSNLHLCILFSPSPLCMWEGMRKIQSLLSLPWRFQKWGWMTNYINASCCFFPDQNLHANERSLQLFSDLAVHTTEVEEGQHFVWLVMQFGRNCCWFFFHPYLQQGQYGHT